MEIVLAIFGFLILTEVIYIEIRLRKQIEHQEKILKKMDVILDVIRRHDS